LFVKGRTSYLRCLCLFAHSGVQHLLCCVFVLFFFVLCTLGCSNIISRSLQSSGSEIALSHISKKYSLFIRPSRDGTVLCDWAWLAGGGRAGGWSGGRPHRFPHNNFSSVYRIFTNLSHMIPLWKGKNPIYFGVIRSKVKVTVTTNIIFDNRVVSAR
jgi:hypothetical protein